MASGERLGELGVAIWEIGSSTEDVIAVSQIFEQWSYQNVYVLSPMCACKTMFEFSSDFEFHL